jgi:predicted transcriptional regulator
MAARGKLYEPTDADRQFVSRCIIAGDMSIESIAECLNITDDTLRKHFRYEIVTARAALKGKAVGVINDALTDGSVDAAKFVLARIAGWSEKQGVEHSGKVEMTHKIERVIVRSKD